MHVPLLLYNLFPLKSCFFRICTKAMYENPQKTWCMLLIFSFSALGNTLKFSTSKGIITSLQCWNFLKKELFMMVRSVINPLNKQKNFNVVIYTWSSGTTNDDISSNKCLNVLKYVSACPDCIGSIPRVNDPDPVLT